VIFTISIILGFFALVFVLGYTVSVAFNRFNQ
jgi:hypothetical protein